MEYTTNSKTQKIKQIKVNLACEDSTLSSLLSFPMAALCLHSSCV